MAGMGTRGTRSIIQKHAYTIGVEYPRRCSRFKSLVKASKELECTDLLVITWDYGGEEDFRGNGIRFVPLWKWLLG